MRRTPSPTYSPDLEWWLRDSGAALGECSALGPSLERMQLYGRRPWKPERRARGIEDRDRDLACQLPGEEDSIDPRDYFVDGNPIEVQPRSRTHSRKRTPIGYSAFGVWKACPSCKGLVGDCATCGWSGAVECITAQPTALGRPEAAAFEIDPHDIQRARRVARAWFQLTPQQRHALWLAYMAGIDWGTLCEHRAFRRASAADAELVLKQLAGYFRPAKPPVPEAAELMTRLTPLLLEAQQCSLAS